MLVCPNCNHQQEEGKFCGECGTETVESTVSAGEKVDSIKEETSQEDLSASVESQPIAQEQTAATIEQSNVNTQQTVEVTKQALGQYWDYVLLLLKNPSRAFNLNMNYFVYGLVTIGIYAIAFSLSLYFLGNSYYKKFAGIWSETSSLPFFEINSRMVFFMIICMAILFFSAFIVIKLAKSSLDFKTLIAQFGGLIVPFASLNVIAILGGLIGSLPITLIPIYLSVLFVFIYIPVVFTYEKVSQVNNQGQKVYFSLLTVILIIVFSMILSDVVIVNMLENLEEIVPSLF